MIENILITSAGRRVSLVKSFQKTLSNYNQNAKVFTTDMNPKLSSACMVSDGYFEVPRVSDENYLSLLKDICKKNKICMIIPTIDTELEILSLAKEEFLKEGIHIIISSKEICNTFFLKSKTEEFFVKSGFKTPLRVKDLATCDYPVFAKFDNSSCSIGAKKVYSREEAKEMAKDENYVFQEFIDGDEYTVDVYMDRHSNPICIVPRLRLEVRAGEISKGLCVKDEKIIHEIKALCKKLQGAHGCITIQLFKTKKDIIFIEINPRFGGGYPLSYESGANFAKFLFEEYLGNELTYTQEWRDKTLMLRYDAEVIVDGYSL